MVDHMVSKTTDSETPDEGDYVCWHLVDLLEKLNISAGAESTQLSVGSLPSQAISILL